MSGQMFVCESGGRCNRMATRETWDAAWLGPERNMRVQDWSKSFVCAECLANNPFPTLHVLSRVENADGVWMVVEKVT